MSTFSKLSLVAQYDDMCRLVNQLIRESADEEEASLNMLHGLQKRWNAREAQHERDKVDLKSEIGALQKEIKKLNRQLAESRAALVRESNEKKTVAHEKKALMEQIKQVRILLESKEGANNSEAYRKRAIKYLNAERLSPVQSDESDESDGCGDLDYDKTEEDILEPTTRARRSTNAFDEVLESLPSTEQPTLVYRYLNKDSDEDNMVDEGRLRSATRRSATLAHVSEKTRSSGVSTRSRTHQAGTGTDSNSTDDNEIERVRQELKQYEAEKREKLLSANSTPNIKNQKASTLSAKSTTSLMRSAVNLAPSTPSAMKPHSFVSKKIFKPDNCGPCGGKISFYGNVVKCEECGVISHPECKEKCPLPCVKITAPNTRSRQKKILISDYVNNDADPKVPALIVHCCNEIERTDNIKQQALYRVVARASEIEELQQKILKSKAGMPNLSKLDVHLLAGVVKRFLQSLDETLITTTLWCYFAEAVKQESSIEIRTHLAYYIANDLPKANRETLAFLMQHFHAIARFSSENNMTIKNLAKTLAPTIVGNSCRNPSQTTILSENKTQLQIMEALFDIEQEFWEKFVQRVPSTTRTTSLGSRLLTTPSSSAGAETRSSRLADNIPTPKLKSLFS